jgi:hypothetical protein
MFLVQCNHVGPEPCSRTTLDYFNNFQDLSSCVTFSLDFQPAANVAVWVIHVTLLASSMTKHTNSPFTSLLGRTDGFWDFLSCVTKSRHFPEKLDERFYVTHDIVLSMMRGMDSPFTSILGLYEDF